MSNTYKFLGTISASYYFASADENYYVTLAVFYNANGNLKIHYNSLAIEGSSEKPKRGKIILKDRNNDYYITNFNKKGDTKVMILREFLRSKGITSHYAFEIVY